MRRPTIRYILFATGAIAACLAVHQVPYPPPVIIDLAVTPNAEPPPVRVHHVLSWWPVRAGTFFVGISTFMHVLTSLAGLSSWRQWFAAIAVPTSSLTAWYWYTVRYLNYHPGSLDEGGHIQIGLIGFTLGFALVAFVNAIPDIFAKQCIIELPGSTELPVATVAANDRT